MARTADDGGDGREWLRQTMHRSANHPAYYDSANQMTRVENIFHDDPGEVDHRLSIAWLFGFTK